MKHLRSSTTVVCFFLACWLAIGCVSTGRGPENDGATRASTTSVAALTPAATVPPSPVPTATVRPAATRATATLTPPPTPAAVPSATPEGTESAPTPARTIEIWVIPGPPGKIGSGLAYLMMARDRGVDKADKELIRVLEFMEQRGGAAAVVWFDHILSDAEVSALEGTYGVRFLRVGGKVSSLTPIYSAVVPWEQIVAVASLPYVKVIDSSGWPPPVSP